MGCWLLVVRIDVASGFVQSSSGGHTFAHKMSARVQVLLVFCNDLYTCVTSRAARGENGLLKTEPQESKVRSLYTRARLQVGDRQPLPAERMIISRARLRWFLLVTLVNNPQLIVLRLNE